MIPIKAFYVEELFDGNESIGLVINLVSHHIRYDEDYIKNRNVDYVKLTVKGGGVVPTDDEFDAFVTVIKQFQSKSNKGNLTVKTSTWNECVFSWMSHPTYVISLSSQAK